MFSSRSVRKDGGVLELLMTWVLSWSISVALSSLLSVWWYLLGMGRLLLSVWWYLFGMGRLPVGKGFNNNLSCSKFTQIMGRCWNTWPTRLTLSPVLTLHLPHLQHDDNNCERSDVNNYCCLTSVLWLYSGQFIVDGRKSKVVYCLCSTNDMTSCITVTLLK